jgi:hypothetical protein
MSCEAGQLARFFYWQADKFMADESANQKILVKKGGKDSDDLSLSG